MNKVNGVNKKRKIIMPPPILESYNATVNDDYKPTYAQTFGRDGGDFVAQQQRIIAEGKAALNNGVQSDDKAAIDNMAKTIHDLRAMVEFENKTKASQPDIINFKPSRTDREYRTPQFASIKQDLSQVSQFLSYTAKDKSLTPQDKAYLAQLRAETIALINGLQGMK
jgi:hypothetical protein